LVLPFTQCLYLNLGATALYVPLMGRAGAGNNAEVVVGLLIGAKYGLLFTCIVSIDSFWDEGLDSLSVAHPRDT